MELEIRANQLQPNDIIIDEIFVLGKQQNRGFVNEYKVIATEKIKDRRPRKILAVVCRLQNQGESESYSQLIPWDRRLLVVRPSSPSEAPRTTVEATTPTNTSSASPGAPAGDSRVAALIAEAREEFINKVRKIIRDGYAA